MIQYLSQDITRGRPASPFSISTSLLCRLSLRSRNPRLGCGAGTRSWLGTPLAYVLQQAVQLVGASVALGKPHAYLSRGLQPARLLVCEVTSRQVPGIAHTFVHRRASHQVRSTARAEARGSGLPIDLALPYQAARSIPQPPGCPLYYQSPRGRPPSTPPPSCCPMSCRRGR